MRGRMPAGPEVVEHLQGSDRAKERLRIILETMMGKWRVQEACDRLGICEQRFRQLRDELLQAALERLEGLPAGRPRRAAEPDETLALRQQLEAMQCELQVAQVREEIALALPRVSLLPDSEEVPPAPQKKRPRPR
jgi:transposase-like protein